MNPFVSFIRTTFAGGILFLLPVALLLILLEKAGQITHKLIAPLDPLLPDILLGFDGSRLVVLLSLLGISFVAGLLFLSPRVQQWVAVLEDQVLVNVPGYALIKTLVSDTLGVHAHEALLPVLFSDGETWKPAFLVEENDRHCTLFCPDAPKHDSGEVIIVSANRVKKIPVPSTKLTKSLKVYGKGALAYMDKTAP